LKIVGFEFGLEYPKHFHRTTRFNDAEGQAGLLWGWLDSCMSWNLPSTDVRCLFLFL
jgi:hypothetical protein